MTFNDNIRINSSRVSTSRGGRGAAIGGGSVGLGILALVVYMFTGQDISGLTGSMTTGQTQSQPGMSLEHCQTGADANKHVECRMVATAESLDTLWKQQLPAETRMEYRKPDFRIFENAVNTGCGAATSAVGPFYCPADETVYLDLGFFRQLETQLGAENAPLAQMYIVAHEWGHHIQKITGQMASTQQTGADSELVRQELQADCYAGLWIGHAADTVDPDSGVAFLQAPTTDELLTAIKAAAAVGDDRIQERARGHANPDSFTHGSSEQRTAWLRSGLESGTMRGCDTWNSDL